MPIESLTVPMVVNTDGLPRKVEINRRKHDGSIYVRIHQRQEDCYLEEAQVAGILELMQKIKEVL